MPYTELIPPLPRTNNDRTNTTTSDGPLTAPLLLLERNDSDRSILPSRRRHINRGRILDRDADFYQSRGRWSGVHLMPQESARRNRTVLSVGFHRQNRRRSRCCCGWIAVKKRLRKWMPLLWDDWFHTLAYQRTHVLMLVLFVTYFTIVAGFAGVYLGVTVWGSERTKQSDGSFVTTSYCNMDIADHMQALYFSLSTMTTIGYGVSDYYFGGCWTPFLLVLCQACSAITFDALAVGLLFTRLSRGRKRSKSIVISNQAVVQVVQGTPYFMFRVGELRRFPLMDASVRLFCVRHERIPRVYPAPSTRRPMPPPKHNLNSVTADNPSMGIPIETTHFVTRAMKLLHPDESLMHSNHILMSLPQVIVHRMDDKSPLMPPAEWYDSQGKHHTFPQNEHNMMDVQSQIQEFWRDRGLEVVVLVEGIDELTGTNVQTRHSYCTSYSNSPVGEEEEGDVAWNRAFVNCIVPFLDDDEDLEGRAQYHSHYPVCTVDFARFHDTVPTPRDCLASPYVPY